jgi:DNA repair protein RecO (recombination protein O)
MLLRKQSGSLDLLTEAALEKGFSPLGNSSAERNSLQILYAGYYVAELLSELTHEDDPHPALFDAVVETLRLLESSVDVWLALRRFELVALRETGHLPALDQCAGCTAPLGDEPLLSFSVRLGGVLCRGCSAKHGATARIHAGTLKTMRLLGDVRQTNWRRLRLTADANGEMRTVASAAVQYLTGRPLRTAKLLGDGDR